MYIRRKKFISLYYISIFCIFLIFVIAEIEVESSDRYQLDKFIELEQNNQVEHAKYSTEFDNRILQSYLHQFNTSAEFRVYIHKNALRTDMEIAILSGVILAIIADITIALAGLIKRRLN